MCKTPTEGVPKGVSLVSTGPSIPYTRVENSILLKRGAVVATNLKRFAHGFGEKAQIGLLSSKRFAELNALLRKLGAYTLSSSSLKARAAARVVHTLTVRDDDGFHRAYIGDPDPITTPKWWAVMEGVRNAVRDVAEPIPFWDAMLLPEESGRLYIDAEPKGLIEIGGVQLGQTTPFGPVRARIGRHTVRLTDPKSDFSQTYDVHVVRGKTTSLKVELR